MAIFFRENIDDLLCIACLKPVLVDVNRPSGLRKSSSGPRHGVARQDLNWGKISRFALRKPIGDALQLDRRLAWLQPQGINAC